MNTPATQTDADVGKKIDQAPNKLDPNALPIEHYESRSVEVSVTQTDVRTKVVLATMSEAGLQPENNVDGLSESIAKLRSENQGVDPSLVASLENVLRGFLKTDASPGLANVCSELVTATGFVTEKIKDLINRGYPREKIMGQKLREILSRLDSIRKRNLSVDVLTDEIDALSATAEGKVRFNIPRAY